MQSSRSPGDAPLVSVAMASYNGEQFIAEQLDSILLQTYTNLEIIIIDDCSTDSTREILKSYQQKDSRIELFFNEANIGYKAAFYNAIQHCKGAYLMFCDQDDTWKHQKVETLLSAIQDNLLIFSDSELINEAGASMNLRLSDTVCMQQPGEPCVNRGFVIGNCVWGHTILFHRSLLNYTSVETNDHPHDWWFAVVSSQLNKIAYCPMVLNYYRQHGRNVTQAMPGKTGRVAGRKQAEFELQLSRIESIAALPFNDDKAFYQEWQQLFMTRKQGFSIALFKFLVRYRKDVFSFKRKNILAQLVEIRKMSRGLS